MTKKVLVTGADGFIGSHLVEEFILNSYKVKVFVYYNSINSWGWLYALLKNVKNKIEVSALNIISTNGVRTAMRDVNMVFNFVPITELHSKQAQSPYSASKIGSACLVDSYYRSLDLQLAIVRRFNSYGPRQSARAVIPTIITQLLYCVTEINLGDVSPTRDLLLLKDIGKAFAANAKSESLIRREVNITNQSEVSDIYLTK